MDDWVEESEDEGSGDSEDEAKKKKKEEEDEFTVKKKPKKGEPPKKKKKKKKGEDESDEEQSEVSGNIHICMIFFSRVMEEERASVDFAPVGNEGRKQNLSELSVFGWTSSLFPFDQRGQKLAA